MKIGIFLICTGKYDIFLQPLIDSLDKYFFTKDPLVIYLFSDKTPALKMSKRISLVRYRIEHKPFPSPTLHRYKYFSTLARVTTDYVFYMDVDMKLVGRVDREILPFKKEHQGIVATLHPGFYRGGGGWCNNKDSLAYTQEDLRNKYYAGGFQGGRTKEYLKLCKILADNITCDEKKNVIATWHDESHWNAYLNQKTPKSLTPQYCMVEEKHLRSEWGIDHFTPKIIALAKDHEKLR